MKALDVIWIDRENFSVSEFRVAKLSRSMLVQGRMQKVNYPFCGAHTRQRCRPDRHLAPPSRCDTSFSPVHGQVSAVDLAQIPSAAISVIILCRVELS